MNNQLLEKQYPKRKRVPVQLNERYQRMIDELKEVRGYDSASEVIKAGIMALHLQVFPPYLQGKARGAEPLLTKAERKIQSEAREESAWKKLCTKLGGKAEGAGENMVCTYIVYHATPPSLIEEFPQTLPCSYITESTFDTQYYPDRKTVMNIRGLNEKKKNHGS